MLAYDCIKLIVFAPFNIKKAFEMNLSFLICLALLAGRSTAFSLGQARFSTSLRTNHHLHMSNGAATPIDVIPRYDFDVVIPFSCSFFVSFFFCFLIIFFKLFSFSFQFLLFSLLFPLLIFSSFQFPLFSFHFSYLTLNFLYRFLLLLYSFSFPFSFRLPPQPSPLNH